eukprot:NODE_90_length_21577_cov_0.697691.p6 type:complete len:386 gc:universal NODE_90_length_21577_cov_0.697691:12614-11457(-)
MPNLDLMGLRNFGNTCYINSVLQILHNIEHFPIDGDHKWNKLIKAAYHDNQLKPLISHLSKNKKHFKKNKQGDAQELLLFLLGYIKGSNFQVTMSSNIKCRHCKYVSNSKHESNMLFINPKVSLEKNLEPESTILSDYKCEKCHRRGATKVDEVHGHPQLLILSINAYRKKSTVPLSFAFNGENEHYNLVGMIVHLGSDNCGHYIAIVKKNGIWYECNDSRIMKLSEADVRRYKPYVVFYERKAKKRHRDELSFSESSESISKKSRKGSHGNGKTSKAVPVKSQNLDKTKPALTIDTHINQPDLNQLEQCTQSISIRSPTKSSPVKAKRRRKQQSKANRLSKSNMVSPIESIEQSKNFDNTKERPENFMTKVRKLIQENLRVLSK